MECATGTYTGNGTSQSIAVGFQPEVVFLQDRPSGSTTGPLTLATAAMTAGDSFSSATAGACTTCITSIDSNGFSVGSSSTVNESSQVYHWCCFGADAEVLDAGTYAGDGNDDRTITTACTGTGGAGWVFTVRDRTQAAMMFKTGQSAGTDISMVIFQNSGGITNRIQDISATTFDVGSGNEVNASGSNYFYVFMQTKASVCEVGGQDGDGLDDRTITLADTTINPKMMMVRQASTNARKGAFRIDTLVGDLSWLPANALGPGGEAANMIQAMAKGSFELGTDASVNANDGAGKPYNWFVVQATPAAAAIPIPALPGGGSVSAPFQQFNTAYSFTKGGIELESTFKNTRIL